jgi:hypothetical protein
VGGRPLIRSPAQLSPVHHSGQKTQSVAQLAYGTFALLTAITRFSGPRWARLSRAGWILSCTVAAALASIVWGGTTLAVALLSGGGGAVVASMIVWLLHAGTRGLTSA